MVICYILCAIAGTLIVFHILLETNYFLRMILTLIIARFFRRKVNIMETSTVGGICLTTDIDTLITHMNNARFLRELDFARVDFYERSDLYRTIVSKKGAIVQGAATIRYRRFIKVFTRFEITTKIIYWDEQSIFMEHKFIGKTDGFIHAIVICRQRLIDCSAEEVMDILLKKNSHQESQESICSKMENGELSKVKPELPDEVAKWIESNEISSAKLRKGC